MFSTDNIANALARLKTTIETYNKAKNDDGLPESDRQFIDKIIDEEYGLVTNDIKLFIDDYKQKMRYRDAVFDKLDKDTNLWARHPVLCNEYLRRQKEQLDILNHFQTLYNNMTIMSSATTTVTT